MYRTEAQQIDFLQAQLARSDNTRELRLVSLTNKNLDNKSSSALRNAWEPVSQCAAVWALSAPRELATETDMVEGQALLESVEAVAVGIDPGLAGEAKTICIALAPRPGYEAKAVQKIAVAAHAKLLTMGQAAATLRRVTHASQAEADQLSQLLKDLSTPDFDIVKTTGGRNILVVRASTTASFPDLGE